jgi:hypothetical protein
MLPGKRKWKTLVQHKLTYGETLRNVLNYSTVKLYGSPKGSLEKTRNASGTSSGISKA